MSQEIKASIARYLEEVSDISLATAGKDGAPYAAIVSHVNTGNCLYFISSTNTNKMQNISSRPEVAFTANKPNAEWTTLQSVQMRGKASTVTDEKEIGKVFRMLQDKFPEMEEMPDIPGLVIVKVVFTYGYYSDNTKGFGHRDEVSY